MAAVSANRPSQFFQNLVLMGIMTIDKSYGNIFSPLTMPYLRPLRPFRHLFAEGPSKFDAPTIMMVVAVALLVLVMILQVRHGTCISHAFNEN